MLNRSPQHKARLIFDPMELRYSFGPQHPLQPGRVKGRVDLLE
jgi:hypothetical protein